MSGFLSFLQYTNSLLWGGPLLLLLCFTHGYFSWRTRFIQKKLPKALQLSITNNKSSISSSKSSHGLDSFASLATTLAATLGTGNIIGISTAIAFGGPGAVFWCWITGVFGMATSYVECYLSLLFRQKREDGSFHGGPMYLMKYQLKRPKMAAFYAYLLLASSFCVGCSTQSQAVTDTLHTLFNIPKIISGIVLSFFIGLVLLKGIKGIGTVCTFLVPAMGFFYLFACIILLFFHMEYLLDALKLILSSAFSFSSISGGILGSSLLLSARYGIARGLFTNEAGLGSAPITAANSDGEANQQALVLMSATFWDTVVMCGVTGLVIVSAGLALPQLFTAYAPGDYTFAAFSFLPLGSQILAISIIFFAMATLLGWSFFGEKATEFLFGIEQIKTYRFLYCCMIFVGSQMTLSLVWELSDFLNALMIIPNILSLFLLQKYLPKN